MKRTPHVHVLDTGEGDWEAYAGLKEAEAKIKEAIADHNSFADAPITRESLTIVDSEEWCADAAEPCYYDREMAVRATMRQVPDWTYSYPPQDSKTYRVNGKRVPRWKMACSMSIDQAMNLWPFDQDYGNAFGYCQACTHWREMREEYLADWATDQTENAEATGQLALL